VWRNAPSLARKPAVPLDWAADRTLDLSPSSLFALFAQQQPFPVSRGSIPEPLVGVRDLANRGKPYQHAIFDSLDRSLH